MMNRERKLMSNSLILTIGNVLPRFSTFITLPILTAALTKKEYGQYDLIITSMSLILPLVSLLIEQGVFRFLLESNLENDRKKIITNSLLYIGLVSIILFLLGVITLRSFTFETRITISIYLVLNLYYKYILQVCRGLKLLRLYSFSSLINSLLTLIFIVIVIGIMDKGFYGLIILLLISLFITIIIIIYSSHIYEYVSIKEVNYVHITKLLKYSVPMIPNSLSWWIVGVSDRWIITAILGIEMNAIYAISNKIPNLFNSIYNNFNLAWQESATMSFEDNDATEYYSNIFNHLFNFLIGMLIALITVSPLLFILFIDNEYYLAYYQMPILFLAMFFSSMSAYYGGIYIALKKSKSIGFSSFIAAIINLLINITFISKFGLYAASFSTLLSYITLTLYRAIDINKYISIKYNFKKISILLTVTILVLILNYLNNLYLNIFNFIIAIPIAIFININFLKGFISSIKK